MPWPWCWFCRSKQTTMLHHLNLQNCDWQHTSIAKVHLESYSISYHSGDKPKRMTRISWAHTRNFFYVTLISYWRNRRAISKVLFTYYLEAACSEVVCHELMLKRNSFAPVFKKYFQLQKRAVSRSSRGWCGQWIFGSKRAGSLELNDGLVCREGLLWELRKGTWVRFLRHSCAGPSSRREPLCSQDWKECKRWYHFPAAS